MSWDVSVRINTGNGKFLESGSFNQTYNVSQMFRRAFTETDGDLFELRDLHGMICKNIVWSLNNAVKYMQEHSEEMRKLNPSNGWGNYEGALEFLAAIHELCLEHPLAVVNVD